MCTLNHSKQPQTSPFLCVILCDKHCIEHSYMHTKTCWPLRSSQAAVFTYSSRCLSLFRPQLVFSTPGPALRVDSFCRQREKKSCQRSDLRGHRRVNRPSGIREEKAVGPERWDKDAGILPVILPNPDRTRQLVNGFARKNYNRTIERPGTTPAQCATVSHRHRCVSSSSVSSDGKWSRGSCWQTSAPLTALTWWCILMNVKSNWNRTLFAWCITNPCHTALTTFTGLCTWISAKYKLKLTYMLIRYASVTLKYQPTQSESL